MQEAALDRHTLVNRTKQDCITHYSTSFGVKANVLVVAENTPMPNSSEPAGNSSVVAYQQVPATSSSGYQTWTCKDFVNLEHVSRAQNMCLEHKLTQQGLDDWVMFGHKTLYCLSEQQTGQKETCRLNYSLVILTGKSFEPTPDPLLSRAIAICCLSSIKCICVVALALWIREETLYTLGDAISSFLRQPDRHTKDMGVVAKAVVQNSRDWQTSVSTRWNPRSLRWYHAASWKRWLLTYSLYACIGMPCLQILTC